MLQAALEAHRRTPYAVIPPVQHAFGCVIGALLGGTGCKYQRRRDHRSNARGQVLVNLGKGLGKIPVLGPILQATDHTPHFLWSGLMLLAVGVVLPSLVVVLGGGREPQS